MEIILSGHRGKVVVIDAGSQSWTDWCHDLLLNAKDLGSFFNILWRLLQALELDV